MTIENVTSISNNSYNTAVSKKDSNAQEFVIPQISEQQSESRTVKSDNVVDPINTMEAMTGKAIANESSYSVSDDDIKYFREKYGDMYNENTAGELYYDLADKGIISINDASSSSNTVAMIPLSAVKRVVYFGTHLIGRENMRPLRSFSDLTDDVVYIKDISREDKDAYKYEWESFKKKYDRDINTWKDALQESIDFERYLKEIAKNSASDKHYPSQWRFDNIIESLEKTKDVISQIFD